MVANQEVLLSINGNLIANSNLESLPLNMPPEAALLLARIKNTVNTSEKRTAPPPPPPPVMKTSVKPEPPVCKKVKTFSEIELAGLSSGHKVNISTGKFFIYEDGTFLGMTIGKTSRDQVLKIMQQYSSVNYMSLYNSSAYNYTDLGISIRFNEAGIVQEINIGKGFSGQTSKGLRMGDSIYDAFNIYGKPQVKLPQGAVWGRFAVFSDDDLITSIRLS
jgi:hypothetical protein